MTSLESELGCLVGGRIDGAHVNPDTGLLALSVYAGHKHLLGVGIGPLAAGIGWLPRPPRLRAGASHPLVAALRAHLVDRRVRHVAVDDDGTIWISAGGEGVISRLALVPGRRGEARVLGPTGELVLRFPPRGAEGNASGLVVPEDLAAAGAAMLERSERAALERARSQLVRAVARRVQALARRAEAVRADLRRLDDVERLQRIGRLLLAQGPRVPRGARTAVLEDWETGGNIEVTLDPARPAKAQAETFFAKARRYQRGAAVMQQRLAESVRAAEAAEALARELAEAPAEVSALEALAARARSLGVTDAVAPGAQAGGRPRPRPRLPYVLYRAADNRPILVGRGGRDNDALITHHARPHDLWLHAKGVTGAHVIVPLEKGQSCPAELLVDAATLAAYHSDARGEASCEVSYVERRYVRKPRGSAPGAVTFDREKVLVVRIEPGRLARLLAARDEG